MKKILLLSFALLMTHASLKAQRNETKANDSNTPLHLLKPDYPIPYGKVEIAEVTKTLNRILGYLDTVTPAQYVNAKSGAVITDLSKMDENTVLKKGNFRLVSYEWGVTYGAMFLATEGCPF